MIQLEQWGCPWSRKDDGHINVRYFGGMKVPRTWFAADRSGFHILHTLFQTSLKYPQIRRYDEFFCTDLLVEDGRVRIDDHSLAFNTDWLTTLELGYSLEVAQAMAHSALQRKESRGAHQRLDGYTERDDAQFMKHSLAHYTGDGAPDITLQPVVITKSQPRARVYGGAGKKAEMS